MSPWDIETVSPASIQRGNHMVADGNKPTLPAIVVKRALQGTRFMITLKMGSPDSVNLLGLTTPNRPLVISPRSSLNVSSAGSQDTTRLWARSKKTFSSWPFWIWTRAVTGPAIRSPAGLSTSKGFSRRNFVRPRKRGNSGTDDPCPSGGKLFWICSTLNAMGCETSSPV